MRTLPRPHRRDESILLDALAHAPAERPRAVDAPRLACKPGTSRAVLDALRAETVRHHTPADLIPLPLMRTVPLDQLRVAVLDALRTDTYAAVAGAHAVLDDIETALAEIVALMAEVDAR